MGTQAMYPMNRQDNPEVPNQPHHTTTVSLDLAGDREIRVEYFTPEGEIREVEGIVTNTMYEKFEADGEVYTIVMSPSGSYGSPMLAAESADNYLGYIISIVQADLDCRFTQVIYDEDNNIYPSPYLPKALVDSISNISEGNLVTIEAANGEVTGVVTEIYPGEPVDAVVVDNSSSKYCISYGSHGPYLVQGRRRDVDREEIETKSFGDVVDVTVRSE